MPPLGVRRAPTSPSWSLFLEPVEVGQGLKAVGAGVLVVVLLAMVFAFISVPLVLWAFHPAQTEYGTDLGALLPADLFFLVAIAALLHSDLGAPRTVVSRLTPAGLRMRVEWQAHLTWGRHGPRRVPKRTESLEWSWKYLRFSLTPYWGTNAFTPDPATVSLWVGTQDAFERVPYATALFRVPTELAEEALWVARRGGAEVTLSRHLPQLADPQAR